MKSFPREQVKVIQDGSRFYDDSTGDELFESSVVVKDGDVSSAKSARTEFLNYIDKDIPVSRIVFV